MSTGAHDLRELEQDPRLFLYTSLTSGSSHIITATSRMETILKANKIPFQAVDTATDEKARRLWGRRAGKRKLPGLVKEGFVIGDLEAVEEWNEFGELKENIGPVPASNAVPAPKLPVKPTATGGSASISEKPEATPNQHRVALPGAAEIAARNKAAVTSSPAPVSNPISTSNVAKPETMTSAPSEKVKSIKIAGEPSRDDHLSAPPSAFQSGTATPAEPAVAGAETSTLSAVPKALQQEHPGIDHLSAPPSQNQSGTATPAEPAAPEPAPETLSAVPKSLQKEDHPGLDHLSAPPSGIVTPSEPADGATGEQLATVTSVESTKSEHRGSELQAAPQDVVKEIEQRNSITEEQEPDDIEQVGEGIQTQEQNAKDGTEAGKSVED